MATYQIDFVKDNYAFLIGNGINSAMGKGNCDWNDVLFNLAGKSLQKKFFDGDRNHLLSSTEILNAIQLRRRKKQDITVDIAKEIRRISFDKEKTSSLLLFAKEYGVDILTTNFDMNIERYLWETQYRSIKQNTGSCYNWTHFYSDRTNKSSCKVWHIHGCIAKWRSILFSTTRYMRAAAKATEILNDKKNDRALLKSTWLGIVMTRPLVIAGWRCAESETFLRWLLIERMMYQKSQKQKNPENKLPQSYFLYRKTSNIERIEKFLKIVEIQPICLDTIFDNGAWNLKSSTVKLREVKR